MNGALRRLLRRWHGLLGLATAGPLVLIVLTGFLLLHPRLVGAPGEAPRLLGVDPGDPDRRFRAAGEALELSEDAGETWRELPLLYPVAEPAGLAFAPGGGDTVYLALAGGDLLRSDDRGFVWERVAPVAIRERLGRARLRGLWVGEHGVVALAAEAGLLLSEDGGETWTRSADWSPGGEAGLADWVHRLHTGWFGPPWLRFAYDGVAVVALALAFTGIAVMARGRGASR